MERLGRRSLEAFSRFVEEIYSVDDLAALPAAAASAVLRLVPGDIVAYNEVNLGNPEITVVSDPPE